MPIPTAEERLGQCVADRYRLDALLSSGGMGILFEALDQTTGQRVAVKMLKPVHALDSDRHARFLREMRIATSLRHPSIAPVLDAGTDAAGAPFLVMELLEGRSLQQELDERGHLSFGETLAVLLPIADALATAHAAGIIHRDVKPANIFLTRAASGKVVPNLLDFGVAKTFDDEFDTQTGLTVGTPEYMAPEQARRGESGPFTDIWAVGAVVYRCLSGSVPYGGGSPAEVFAKLLREPVPPLAVSGVSKATCATIERALTQDPSRRYPSMKAFARALAASTSARDRDSRPDAPHADVTSTLNLPIADATATERPVTAASVSPTSSARRQGLALRVLALAGVAGAVALLGISFAGKTANDAGPLADETQALVRSPGFAPPLVLPLSSLSSATSAPSVAVSVKSRTARPAVTSRRAHGPLSVRTSKPKPAKKRTSARVAVEPEVTAAPVSNETTAGLPVATEW